MLPTKKDKGQTKQKRTFGPVAGRAPDQQGAKANSSVPFGFVPFRSVPCRSVPLRSPFRPRND